MLLIAELFTHKISDTGQNAEDYSPHEKFFHPYLLENSLIMKANR